MANEFKKNVGGPISKKDAQKWIDKFDKDRKKDTKAVFFGKDVFDQIFTDARATGVSIFFARKIDASNKEYDDLILVPTAEDGTLLWTDDTTDTSKLLLNSNTYDNGVACPPYCAK